MRSARIFRASRASERQAPDASRQRTGYHRLDPSRCLRVPAENLEDTLPKAEQAAKDGAQIICTQELFASQYFRQSEDHKNLAMAEPIPGPTTEAFQRSHAITNGCCVASVNRIGHEAPAGRDGIEFRGQSFIADTPEETIANAGQEETILLCEIDLAKVDVTRTHWPFLRDRRIDAYGDLTCRLIDE